VETIDKIFGAIVTFLAFCFALQLLSPIVIYGGVREVTKEYLEITGTPTRMVDIIQFKVRATDTMHMQGEARGVLRNSSDNPLSKIYITVSYYKCSSDKNNQSDMQDLTGCKQLEPSGIGSESYYEIQIDLKPHSDVTFIVAHQVDEYYGLIGYNRDYGDPGYFVKIVPHVSDAI
jgi:hypothetical protein